MDAKHLKRLKAEQDRALAEAEIQLQQWNKFYADYVALQDRLKNLPDKLTHDVMVPFGSLAFMPGQFVHTNEILVLLGDNYFVECSAKHAVDIVARRIRGVDKEREGLKKQKELLMPRSTFTSEMIYMAEGHSEEHEISELYDEEKEKEWRDRHREYLRQAGERRQMEREKGLQTSAEVEKGQPLIRTDEELWERLDQLERQEQQEREFEILSSEESDTARVSSSGSETDDDSEEDGVTIKSTRTITFSHTKLPTTGLPDVQSNDQICSPADIYKMVQRGPRSILKMPSSGNLDDHRALTEDGIQKSVKFAFEDQKTHQAGISENVPSVNSLELPQKAFKDVVVEREVTAPASGSTVSKHVSLPSPFGDAVSLPRTVTTSLPLPSPSGDASFLPCTVSSVPGQVSLGEIQKTFSVVKTQHSVTAHSDIKTIPSRPMSKFRASRQKQSETS